jgi:hypothetical protein
MDATTVFNKSQCSVEVSRNSKGYTWTVKAYGDTLEECIAKAKEADEKLKALYPG